MKAFVVVSCLLAVASAVYNAPAAHHGAQHIPVIGAHGVPLEPPANVAARAAHAAAHAAASAHGTHYTIPTHAYTAAPAYGIAAASHGVPHDTLDVAKASGHAGNGIYRSPIAIPYAYTPTLGHGYGALPLDTPEVAAAKAAHFAAHATVTHGGLGAAHGAYDDGSYRGEYNGAYSHRHDDGSYYGNWF